MRKLFSLAAAALLFAVFTPATAEDLPQIPLGSGQTVTHVVNDQTVTFTSAGINATVLFNEVSAANISGIIKKTAPMVAQGSVRINWVTQNRVVTIPFAPGPGDQQFSLEGGEGDKRNPEMQ